MQYFRRGRFLAGVEETWVQARRMHLETMKERALVWLAEAYGQHGQYAQAETLLSEALSTDPTNENLLCSLMQAFHQAGLTHQAVRSFEEFARTLRKMGMEPAEATTALYEHVRRAPQGFDMAALTRTAPLQLPLCAPVDHCSEGISMGGFSGALLPENEHNEGAQTADSLTRGSFGLLIWGMQPK